MLKSWIFFRKLCTESSAGGIQKSHDFLHVFPNGSLHIGISKQEGGMIGRHDLDGTFLKGGGEAFFYSR